MTSLTTEKLNDFINLLGQGSNISEFFPLSLITILPQEIGAKDLSIFTQDQNIRVDNLTDSLKTNQKGVAFFSIRTLAGIRKLHYSDGNLDRILGRTGNYTVQFESQGAKGQQSVPFTLINRITNVSITNNISSKVEVTFGEYSALSIQPVIQLTYRDIQTTATKLVEIKFFEYISDLEINATQIGINNTSIDSVYDAYRRGKDNLDNTVMKTVGNVMSALSNGGKIDKTTQKQDAGFAVNFTLPEETADAKMYFTDLSVNFPRAGKFRLVISVDGIETIPDNIIEVVEKAQTVADQVSRLFHPLLIYSIPLDIFFA